MTNENRELAKRERMLQDRLAEVEQELSDEKLGFVEKGDKLVILEETLKVRDSEIADLMSKNKLLTEDCNVLTQRMMEEKDKMIDMMNEANTIFEGAQR